MQATFLGWFMAFAMMWIVIGNLSMLPPTLLWFAVPLSVLEAYVAVRIINAVDSSKLVK
jgi:ABC-type Co2+ transport system permease subunit